MNVSLLELGEHHRTEPSDRAIGGGKDAGVCPTGYSIVVQGSFDICRLSRNRE